MGMNTLVTLFNDQTNRWPKEIDYAMSGWGYKRQHLEGHFGYGQVLSIAHADDIQLVYGHQNGGGIISSYSDIPDYVLARMVAILKERGYNVSKKKKVT